MMCTRRRLSVWGVCLPVYMHACVLTDAHRECLLPSHSTLSVCSCRCIRTPVHGWRPFEPCRSLMHICQVSWPVSFRGFPVSTSHLVMGALELQTHAAVLGVVSLQNKHFIHSPSPLPFPLHCVIRSLLLGWAG